MLSIKTLRSIYNHLESKDIARQELGKKALFTIEIKDIPKVQMIFNTFKIEKQ